jgi:adenosine deaminase
MEEFIKQMPKAELHLHIEGSLEPELMFELAERNGIQLPYSSVEELRKAYHFSNLQDFLDIYYEGTKVLITEQDFYDLSFAYFTKAHEQNIIHAEIFFDPQSHTARGVELSTVVNGITKAMEQAQIQFGITSHLIFSLLRHLSEEDAFLHLEQAIPLQHHFIGIGLDSSEIGNPPEKFQQLYQMAGELGFKRVAHAGEEGPPQYIWDSLSLLQIDRIDHGNRAMEHENLLNELVLLGMGLTLCPLSNLKLKVVKDLRDHPVKKMLNLGIKATINSDDPAYFGGYLNENLIEVSKALHLDKADLYQLAFNSFEVSFADDMRKREMLVKLDQFYSNFNNE